MKKIGSAFENFISRSFDFSGRASLLEYWLVMPVVWGIIIVLVYGDATEFWQMLLNRRVPPSDPLYWDGLMAFVLTIIPRLSLTVRRLHDSGKNGKWAKLPFVAIISAFFLLLGVLSAVATTTPQGADLGGILAIAVIFGAIVWGAADSTWDVAFATAAILNAIGWDAIWGALAEMTAPARNINFSKSATAISEGMKRANAEEGTLIFVALTMIATPFVAAFLHVFFMIAPGKPDHHLDSTGPIAGASLRRKGDISENPFSGYKYLYDKTPEQQAAHKARAQAQIKSLYQQRVLGQI